MKNITFVENIVMMNFPGQKVLSTLHNKIYSGHQETLENIQWSPGNIGKYIVVTRKHWKIYSGHQETLESIQWSPGNIGKNIVFFLLLYLKMSQGF